MATETNAHRPLVSVLIPCWGCKAYIGEAIRSALAQDYEPLEIIVVEDCGDDGTYEEAMKFSDPRLRVYRNEKNLGQFANKNRCLKFANGEFVKYLDGDDVLEPNCVSILVDAWKNYGGTAGAVLARFSIIDEQGRHLATAHEWGVLGQCDGKGVLELVTKIGKPGSRFGNPSSHLLKKSVLLQIGCFPNDHSYSGDWEAFLKLLCVADVIFIPDVLARYRLQSQSIAHTRKAAFAVVDNIAMVERLGQFFAKQEGLAPHLTDKRFLRKWTIWASESTIMSHFFRKLRCLPNDFDSVRAVFKDQGLGREFDIYIWLHAAPFFTRILSKKLREHCRLPQLPPLFTNRQALYLSTKKYESR
jgi:glycosyltransferase involved in cell wall biosynthesis